MIIVRGIIILLILPLVEDSVYLYDTDDNFSVEFYDCLSDNSLLHCRRPNTTITLQRDQTNWKCYHDGIFQSFTSLAKSNISVNIVLHQWKSSIEKAEEYSRYIRQRQSNELVSGENKYLCQCKHPQSFGKNCEYLLPVGTTFQETLDWEIKMRLNNPWEMQTYGDIVCYTTLSCDSGLLCLDWRDICDGVQQCMLGLDEENCDKLEFNECENDEYRCLNGMCIPEEYFLDGDYDCLDSTDEKQLFDDTKCAFQQANYECDDRLCFVDYFSCGDGQCLPGRVAFQYEVIKVSECISQREQYHMCETHYTRDQWTLPNGKCHYQYQYEEINVKNRSVLEECIYLLRCALSRGAEKNCLCKRIPFCIRELKIRCNSSFAYYPNGRIGAPYARQNYSLFRLSYDTYPDRIDMNATIKCRGYIIVNKLSQLISKFDLHIIEADLCYLVKSDTKIMNVGYDQLCYNGSRTFNNRPYHFIDICITYPRCISAYRIEDGYPDCLSKEDEIQKKVFLNGLISYKASNTCFNIQKHRFRCSIEEETCLLVNKLGDLVPKCTNKYDEMWMGTGTMLSKLVCNTQSKTDCQLIKQYIEMSGKINMSNNSYIQMNLTKNPLLTYCDTFWNLGSKQDEDPNMCQIWWICLDKQWQCRTGQCIETAWILDGEWDCSDASDEEAIFFSDNFNLTRNLKLMNESVLTKKFHDVYKYQPFLNNCNLSIEYPCLRLSQNGTCHFVNNRPCINLSQIGDGHIDCAGAMDERNTRNDCNSPFMLGYNFLCKSQAVNRSVKSDLCMSYNDDTFQSNHWTCLCGIGWFAMYCTSNSDFMCMGGEKCAKGGWCNGKSECTYGDDENLCTIRKHARYSPPDRFYREKKQIFVSKIKQEVHLPQFPTNQNRTKFIDGNISTTQSLLRKSLPFDSIFSSIPFWCNRGVGVYLYDNSTVCFCPPQYYGDKCQFHSDRLTVLFHLDLSQSIYTESNNPTIVINLLIIFLYEDQPLMTRYFYVRPIDEINVYRKHMYHLFYSISQQSLERKRDRYFNRSNIIDKHPYSVRIEAYEFNTHDKARLIAVWLYPIYFDFLPSFRLAKVLRLTKPNIVKDSCQSNPCNSHEECHQVVNENSTYVCLCPNNYKGKDCSIMDELCNDNFCAPNALCKPNYRGLLNGNEKPFCICPFNRIGPRCELIHDICQSNPCQNNGICYATADQRKFSCLCNNQYHGIQCELEKQSVRFYFNEIMEHRGAVVQYFDIDFYTFVLIFVDQYSYLNLPHLLHYQHKHEFMPEIIVVKFYLVTRIEIYVISIQSNISSINETTELSERNRCVRVETLFQTISEISPIKYHYLCNQNVSLFCFIDDSYLCICTENHNRVECFGYDHSLDQCSRCLVGGQCLKGNPSVTDNFVCVCPKCYYGHMCQSNTRQLSFTLDSLIQQDSRGIQTIYLSIALLIFFVGGLTNLASFVTFKRTAPRKFGVGNYLLILSISNQWSLISLVLKMIEIFFSSLLGDISCKTVSYMLSLSTRYTYWLTSWITLERVYTVLFPFGTFPKKIRLAILISIITAIILATMHVHEVLFYMIIKDSSGSRTCVTNYPSFISSYNYITVLIHYLVPFNIQIVSITVLIVFSARSRSRANKNREAFLSVLKLQFNSQKELYITPLIIILSGLPQIIISSSFSCMELSDWQRHLLCIAYFLSYAPQVLGFVLFVVPSTSYMKEFQQTHLSKMFPFRLVGRSKKK